MQNRLIAPSIYQTLQKGILKKACTDLKTSQKQLIQAEKMGALANPDQLAEILVDMKIDSLEEVFFPLWHQPRSLEIGTMARCLAGFQMKTKTIEASVEKTTKIVYTLKIYTQSSTVFTVLLPIG